MTTSPVQLLVFVSDQLACIKIKGRANFTSSIDFKTVIEELVARGFTCFVIDLTDCVLMDSTFLGVLAGLGLKTAAAKNLDTQAHTIELMNPNPRIAELLENLGVLHLFTIISGPTPQTLADATEQTIVPPASATREEVITNCLEAHRVLMSIDPGNVPKFKEVTQFLAEDLKRLRGNGGEAQP
ncbi:MAG TPA: STAS domain-containing protein [Verrucomicrobiae bacterium]|jgi:anti-anti-sigma factor|nr:STAS domain-containing protein [Verrucomicrobiae bacterium]